MVTSDWSAMLGAKVITNYATKINKRTDSFIYIYNLIFTFHDGYILMYYRDSTKRWRRVPDFLMD